MRAEESFAEALDQAARTAEPVQQPGAGFAVETAYAVQARIIGHRIGRGERISGAKLGFTSQAKRVQMGVDDLIIGRVTDAMAVHDPVDLTRFIHPRVEPEVVFKLGADLQPVAVAVGLEIIDSRYRDFTFSLSDVIADNTSAAGYAIGPWQPYTDVSNLGVIMEFDGRPIQIGSTAAILGDPRLALPEAARLARVAGFALEPGWILMAGAATAAEPLRPGVHVRAEIEGLGSVSFTAKESA
ncbi:2-keto-4-pentenoate hydratase [Rhizohabitans arisaemae]|uniref:2-keto-4-pentenoate hydratase n=1 Tax=Rhizohabitans arisaemae TaxID=2720610 RepID=UPI0024B09E02|nr:fumarylacetoacetate hydrolase family protein [Rhizohabitans arisaemae]